MSSERDESTNLVHSPRSRILHKDSLVSSPVSKPDYFNECTRPRTVNDMTDKQSPTLKKNCAKLVQPVGFTATLSTSRKEPMRLDITRTEINNNGNPSGAPY